MLQLSRPPLTLVLLMSFILGYNASFAYEASAQNFSIPTAWRKPTSSLTLRDRRNLLSGLLDTILPTFNSSSGLFNGLTTTQTASLVVALSNSDWISGSTSNEVTVTSSLGTVLSQNPTISSIWGLAAISAYRAYKNLTALQFAQAMWDLLVKYMITNEDAAQGTQSTKGVVFESNCNGASTAGGVFYLRNSTMNTDVNGETVGAFMALSAHLYIETNDTIYLTPASLSASFIFHQLFNGSIILDTITLSSCLTNQDVVTYNSGFVIEGLSLLARLEGMGNISSGVTYQQFLESLVSTTIPNRVWTNATDGILIEGPEDATAAETNSFEQALKGIFIRALYEAYSLTSAGSAMAAFINSFITVQFNAVQDQACGGPGGHWYSSRWEGPPPTRMEPWGQLAALDVLNAAVGIDQASTAVPSGNSSIALSAPSSTSTGLAVPNSPHKQTHPSAKIAAIAGSLSGSLALLAFITLVAVYITRSKRKRLVRGPNAPEAIAPHPIASRRRDREKGRKTERQAVATTVSAERHSDIGQGRGACIYTDDPPQADPSSGLPVHNGDDNKEALATANVLRTPPPLNIISEPLDSTVAAAETTTREQARFLAVAPESPSTSELPELLDRLNRILLRLPPRGVEALEEDPPDYED